ncbi:hypothetical protein ACNQKP_02315 [Bdellovibrio bacteriovorus]|uniref:hypothetical protein n=1 Tax=Bdellovibrio bacteriovorus TaxID=959 RepID=UPI003AA8BDA9
MASFLRFSLFFIGVFFLFGLEPVLGAITRETDFLAPVEPTTVLRSSVIPCYGRNQAGIGRKTNMSRVEGERCSVPQPVEARRLDRPDHEVDDPGKDFNRREL